MAKTNNEKIHLYKALNFNDFDKACILLPYSSEKEVSKGLGFSYKHSIALDDNFLGILLVKENTVITEIEMDRMVVDYHFNMPQKCISKDSFFVLEKNNSGKYFIKFN